MPCAIAVPIRQQIIEQRQQGASIAQIAQALQRSYWSIRTIVRRYRDQGEAGLVPKYQNCGAKGSRFSQRVQRGALWLKRHHPRWGGVALFVSCCKNAGASKQCRVSGHCNGGLSKTGCRKRTVGGGPVQRELPPALCTRCGS
jgi:hypothetical protein